MFAVELLRVTGLHVSCPQCSKAGLRDLAVLGIHRADPTPGPVLWEESQLASPLRPGLGYQANSLDQMVVRSSTVQYPGLD